MVGCPAQGRVSAVLFHWQDGEAHRSATSLAKFGHGRRNDVREHLWTRGSGLSGLVRLVCCWGEFFRQTGSTPWLSNSGAGTIFSRAFVPGYLSRAPSIPCANMMWPSGSTAKEFLTMT